MQTIRLRISDKIYKHLMWFLERFSRDEIQVIKEDDEFLSVKSYLAQELEKIQKGKVQFIDIDQAEEKLESVIRKYED